MISGKLFSRIAFLSLLLVSILFLTAGTGMAIDTDLQWTVEYPADLFPQASSPSWTKVIADNENPPGTFHSYSVTETINSGKLSTNVIRDASQACQGCHYPSGSDYDPNSNWWPLSYKMYDNNLDNATGTTVEAKLKNYGTNQSIGISISDGSYEVTLRINSGSIGISPLYLTSAQSYAMNTTDGYHIYRMTLQGTTVNVYVDGSTTPVITGTADNISSDRNMKFGHYTGHDTTSPGANGDWDYVKYYTGGASAIGDTIDDATDNCPEIYNPTQADTDADGIGDACDTCTDVDKDNYCAEINDCDDNDANIHPGATEVCDGKDNNCNGSTDEGLSVTCYRDFDIDLFGDPFNINIGCPSCAFGYVSNNTDCNDSNGSINPGAIEVCDGADNDCNGSTDENLSTITASAGPNGIIDPPGSMNLGCNDTGTFIIYSDAGYHIASITDTCGGAGYTNSSNDVTTYTYTTGEVTADCSVSAEFVLNQCAPVPSGLVSWWPGNGNANDAVDGNNGTFATNTYAPGKVSQAFSFDGVDDLVAVPDNPTLDITGDVTVHVWAKRTQFSGTNYANIVLKGATMMGGVDAPSAYFINFGPGNVLRAGFETAIGANYVLSGPTITDTEFHHYAYTRSGTLNKLYMDGVEVAGDTFAAVPGATTGIPLMFGSGMKNGSYSEFFQGLVDEVQIYNRALNATEIQTIYNSGSLGVCPIPNISVSPDPYDFGNKTIGTPTTQTFTLSNNGNANLNVTDINLSGSADYTLSTNTGGATCGSTAPTITPGSNCTVIVTLNPSSTGAKNTTLSITSNDPDTGTKNVSISGNGIYGTCNWINPVNGNWSDTSKWSCGHAPGSGDNAFITVDGTYTVTLNVSATVNNLTMGGTSGTQTFSHGANTLTINNTSSFGSNAVYNLSGGTLQGAGDLTINGSFNWTWYGTITGTGAFTTTGTTTINIDTPYLTGRTWTQSGTATVTGNSMLKMGSGAIINNTVGGIFNLNNSSGYPPFSYNGGTNTFNNAGTLNQQSAGMHPIETIFNNSGTVNVDAGTLLIHGGTDTGTYAVDEGATLMFSTGTHDLNSGSSIVGAGIVDFSAGTVNINGTYNITGSTSFTGGTANFNAAATVISVGSTMTITSGTANFSSGDAIDIMNLTISTGTLSGSDTVTVSGLFNWTGYGWVAGTGAFTTTGTTTISGTISGCALSGRTWTQSGTATITGSSNLRMIYGAILNNTVGGIFNLNSSSGSPITKETSTSTFNNAGTLNQQATGTHVIDTTFNNSGNITLDPGILSMSSALTTNITNIKIGGTTAGTEYGRLATTGAATLNGTLNVSLINGFVPNVGDSFTIMTYGSKTGTFSTVNLPSLPAGKWWNPVAYNGTNIVLSVSGDVTPPTVTTTVPSAGATSVALNSNVTINFSENIDCNTVNTTNITISGGGWAFSSCSGNQAVFTTSGQANSTTYTVTVGTGVTDVAGNYMAADYSWSFTTAAPPCTDADGDTYFAEGGSCGLMDCNDSNPAINPGAADINCNGVDENCSGAADEGYISTATTCGVGACAATGATSCVAGSVVDSCTEGSPSAETCNNIDDDCDGSTDEGVLNTYYQDSDSDTYGNFAGPTQQACTPPAGYVANNTDCDDNDPLEYPNQTWYSDIDNDGYSNGDVLTECLRPGGYKAATELTAASGDCDDGDADINPGATEIPLNGIDDDCNPNTHDQPVQWIDNGHYYLRVDVPGLINWNDAKLAAEGLTYLGMQGHLVTLSSGAENLFLTNHPELGNRDGGEDLLDAYWMGGYQLDGSSEPDGGWTWVTGEAFGYTNWGDGEPNNSPVYNENSIQFAHDFSATGKQWNDVFGALWFLPGYVVEFESQAGCIDNDSDGYGSPGDASCPNGAATDCDDTDPSINPGATDINCNDVDENCSGAADEGYVSVSTTCGVGACAGNTGLLVCQSGSEVNTCNPFAGATAETCDNIDNDCDGSTDENLLTITSSSGPNGTISPSGSVNLSCNGEKTFSISPEPGYHVADVLVDGSSVGVVTSYPFTNVTADHTISASFAINTYTVTATATGNGTGTAASNIGGINYYYQTNNTGTTTALNHGTNVVLTATAGTGSKVSWTTCTGAASGNGTATATCTFSSLDGNKTAQATFAAYGSSMPSPPTDLQISGSSSAVLSWTAPTTYVDGTPLNEMDIAGYIISCGGSSGNYYYTIDVGDVTGYTILDILPDTLYCVVQCHDIYGNISEYSNEADKQLCTDVP
jgi:hypothetical protein